jgi:hypothetical protein
MSDFVEEDNWITGSMWTCLYLPYERPAPSYLIDFLTGLRQSTVYCVNNASTYGLSSPVPHICTVLLPLSLAASCELYVTDIKISAVIQCNYEFHKLTQEYEDKTHVYERDCVGKSLKSRCKRRQLFLWTDVLNTLWLLWSLKCLPFPAHVQI